MFVECLSSSKLRKTIPAPQAGSNPQVSDDWCDTNHDTIMFRASHRSSEGQGSITDWSFEIIFLCFKLVERPMNIRD